MDIVYNHTTPIFVIGVGLHEARLDYIVYVHRYMLVTINAYK